jgi:hypothetical protein
MEDDGTAAACRPLVGRSTEVEGGASLPIAAAARNANIEVDPADPT